MHVHVASANQRRLQNEEGQPSGENSGVNIENEWTWNRGMDQIPINRVAESVHHHDNDQQRHEEVEISVEDAASRHGWFGQPQRAMNGRNAELRENTPRVILDGMSSPCDGALTAQSRLSLSLHQSH